MDSSNLMPKVTELLSYQKGTSKFIECVIEMMKKLAPSVFGDKPKLKDVWKLIKKSMEEYIILLK